MGFKMTATMGERSLKGVEGEGRGREQLESEAQHSLVLLRLLTVLRQQRVHLVSIQVARQRQTLQHTCAEFAHGAIG